MFRRVYCVSRSCKWYDDTARRLLSDFVATVLQDGDLDGPSAKYSQWQLWPICSVVSDVIRREGFY